MPGTYSSLPTIGNRLPPAYTAANGGGTALNTIQNNLAGNANFNGPTVPIILYLAAPAANLNWVIGGIDFAYDAAPGLDCRVQIYGESAIGSGVYTDPLFDIVITAAGPAPIPNAWPRKALPGCNVKITVGADPSSTACAFLNGVDAWLAAP